jgi:HlyD family secretion protein
MNRLTLLTGTLALGLLAAGCGSLPLATGASPQAQAISVPAAAVQRGEIQQTIAYSGDVRAREQITVLPKASGRVKSVLVDLGSAVHAGDVLAELEQESPEIQVLQAQANLGAAQAKLSTIQSGAKPDDVAAAEEAQAQQEARLSAMLAQGRAEDVAAAQAGLAAQTSKLSSLVNGGRPEAVAMAQAALDATQQKLILLQNGATDDVRQAAASAVSADTAQVAAMEAAYAALGGTSAADLENLKTQIESLTAQTSAAQTAVTSADAALENQKGASAADLQGAQTAYDQAQATLTAAQAASAQASNPTQASIAQAQAAVEAAMAQQAAAEANQTALEQKASGVCAPLISPITGQAYQQPNGTACGVAKAAADAAVQSGNAAVESAQGQLDLLRRGGAPATQASVQAQVTSAQANVKATKARLDALSNGGVQAQRAQLQALHDQAQSQLTAAQGNLTVAQARLSAAQSGTLDAQRKAAQAQVDAAREKLKADRARLDQVIAGPQDEEVQAAEDVITQAQQQLLITTQPATTQDIEAQRALVEQARQQLQKAQQPYTAYDIEQQQHVVAQAAAQLRTRQNPYTDQDVQTAQAGVDQAQAALQLAQLGVRETQIIAPVDGIVFDRQVSPGALVGPTSPIVVLIPPALEVAVNVDETQLGKVSKGQTVALQVPAYPGESFAGTVTAIAPGVDTKTRTTSVRIQPKDDIGRLRTGMLAQVSIITGAQTNALLVPREAVLGAPTPNGQATVVTLDGGRAERKTVRLGLVNDQVVEISSGLADGQIVAIANASGLNNGDVVAPQLRTALAPLGVQ